MDSRVTAGQPGGQADAGTGIRTHVIGTACRVRNPNVANASDASRRPGEVLIAAEPEDVRSVRHDSEEMLEDAMGARLAVVPVRSDRNGPRLHVELDFDSPGRQRQAVIRWVRERPGWRAIVMTEHDGRCWRSRVSARMAARCTAIANTLLGRVDPGSPITVALLDAGVEPRRAQALADAVDALPRMA